MKDMISGRESEAFTKPIEVRGMTVMERIKYPNWLGFSIFDPDTDYRAIAVDLNVPVEGRASTFAHELGHVKYPVAVLLEDKSTEAEIREQFSELCANYYELQFPSYNSLRMIEKIASIHQELEDLGLTKKQVSRLDKLARRRVSYKGRSLV